MKREIGILCSLLLALFVSKGIYAYDFKVDGLCYNKLSDNTVELTWEAINKPYTGDIVVPSNVTCDGKKYDVVAIGNHALVKVTLVGNSGNVWGTSYNSGLTSIFIPNSVISIGEFAFIGCSGLTSITIPNSVTSIGEYAFDGCSGLTSISIPNSLTSIVRFAFSGCSGLTSITIPNSVTSIGESAFFDCSGLTSITIPKSVTSISYGAFSRCSGLTSIVVENGNKKYDSRDNCNAIIETHSKALISGCKNTIIPNGVTSISNYAFYACNGLTSVTIPNSVTSIGVYAFRGCSAITSVTIPNSVTSIGDWAFSECSCLTTVKIPNSVTSIGDFAFKGCSGLTSITIPISVTSIGGTAFSDCSGIASIVVEKGNTKYDSRDNCNAIIETQYNTLISGCKNTIIPNSVTSIGNSAFRDCSGLTSVTIPNNVTSIGNGAFEGCIGLTSVTIPNSVTSIGDWAFYYCSGLTSVISEINNPFKINENVFDSDNNHIYSNATLIVPIGTKSAYQSTAGWKNFKNIVESEFSISGINYKVKDSGTVEILGADKSLSSVNIFSNVSYNGKLYEVTSIGQESFQDCINLTSITIPNSVTTIGIKAFSGCISLTSIIIPKSVTTIGTKAFIHCSGLTSITVDAGNPNYDSRNNCNAIIDKQSNEMIAACKNTVIPDNVTSIEGAFEGCSGLTTIVIPNSVTRIGTSAFEDCSNLKSVIMPKSLTYIGRYAFEDCSSLTAITIPHDVASIGECAFQDCINLSTITSEIENLFVIEESTFASDNKAIYSDATLIVPKGMKATYQSTAGWNNFKNIKEASDDFVTFTKSGISYKGKSDGTAEITSVDMDMMEVRIPASVSFNGKSYVISSVADNAFVGCTMAALIWDPDFAMSNNALSSAEIGSNFLLYVKNTTYAPSMVKNVIVNGAASSITLSDDGDKFYCPEAFKAQKITYTHQYSMETGGSGKGWETIALPFEVQKITHASRGEMVPFASYSRNSDKKPFWLCKYGNSGFTKANSIQANTPYIIAMPNQSGYDTNYILVGEVTFSSENATVSKTSDFNGTFIPAFVPVTKTASVYALNAINKYVNATGGYDAGSRFISNLRDVRPFEAYIKQSSSSRGFFEINIEDDTTDMKAILDVVNPDKEVDIYTLNGQRVRRVKQSALDDVMEQLPRGVYIVNGKKVLR